MASEQTLIPSTKSLILRVPPRPLFSSSPESVNPRIFLRRRPVPSVRCSVDYDDRRSYIQHQVAYPRPPEIPWKKEMSNTVNLIGVVGTTVEIKHLPSGKVLATARLAVRKSATDTTWVNLTFWDELAHVASQHVEKGNQIFVSGRLVSDTVESEDGKQLTYYKVVVHQLNFVERSFPSGAYNSRNSGSMPERKYNNNAANNRGSVEELWQAFFANPVEWWDNRNNKKSPNYPDFKHKDTGEALWVEGRNNPPWVKSQLEILDSRREYLHDKDDRLPVSPMFVDEFMKF